jgi:hypothetical protein
MKAWILRTLGAVGTLLFASLFALTFYRPAWVERAAKDFITAEVQEQVDAHVAGIDVAASGNALAQAAGALVRQNSQRIAEVKAALRTRLHERVADALARIRNLDCECRDRIAGLLESGILSSLEALDATNARLTDFIQAKYLHVVAEVERDLRIFSGANGAACLLLLILSFAKPRALDHLVFPGILLALAVIVSSYCYVFAQNWFFTIVYSDYFGFAYLAFLGFIFGLLLDIFLNRGRITTTLGNGALHVVGSTLTLSLC